ncbi:hypothetical protein [Pseudomonas fluorescens]|uniref:hypothetical protein n=1 Tax=Pseudomonas fluorescens TaxID=294 RepID=UPI0012B9A979|nr:hypothetical protein [Pseudomonas fluorescens]
MSNMPKKPFSFGQTLRFIHLNHSFDVIDEFQVHLDSAWSQSEARLRKEYEGLSADGFDNELDMEDYRSFLEDDFYQLGEVKKLGQALALSGLYRQFETQVIRVLGSTFPNMGKAKKANILRGISEPEIDCSKLVGFAAVDELRLLNNIIKHAGSKASAELATKYPNWVENTELADLDKAYARLKPLVKQYTHAFVNEAYDQSVAFEAAPAKPASDFSKPS